MAKLNQTLRRTGRPGNVGVITSEATPSGHTHEGGAGYARDIKGELFLLAVANFVGEDTFYEDAAGRDTRYRDLIRAAALADPQWTGELLAWLRTTANLRSASIVGAIEAARVLSALTTSGAGAYPPGARTPRAVLNSVLQRADEPGEALAYWLASYGEPLPKWLKRALGDAAMRLYDPYSYAKWDSERNAVRFADVIEVSQLRRARGDESGLFTYILDARPGAHRAPRVADPGRFPLLHTRAALMRMPVDIRRQFLHSNEFAATTRAAGMTWEAVSGWLQGQMDAAAWEKCIPLMGYGALIKNLANFERAAISKPARQRVIDTLTNPTAVAKSRLLPLAYLNAYNNVPGDTFKAALDEAATLAMARVPAFAGRTLILIDTSSSMNAPFTTRPGRRRADAEQLMRWDAAALYGLALGLACESADLISFSDNYWGTSPASKAFHPKAGENLLSAVARFRTTHFIGGGTETAQAVRRHYDKHDRVVCLTDEQASHDGQGVYAPVPPGVPVHTFNLAGYQHGHAATGPNRWVVGGLSDAAFAMMAALESTAGGRWPWQQR